MPPKSVLLTNDDGPCGRESPYIFGLYRYLTRDLGWHVKVVIPSSQKSWIGKAYQIGDTVKGRYYYPQDPDGYGEISEVSRSLKQGEIAEWILLDGTPATCANVALHNIFPGEIDLVISGPNLGRNSSAAFALSSGTIGAALSSSLSQVRSIAVSYGTVLHPTPQTFHLPAHRLAANIVKHLWENWGKDDGGLRDGEVDLYNVNIPMIEQLLNDEGLQIEWTSIWRNSYGRLFKALPRSQLAGTTGISSAGPDSSHADPGVGNEGATRVNAEDFNNLVFKFAPDFKNLISPSLTSLPVGSDGLAVANGVVSVTPLRASFAEPPIRPERDSGDRIWKIKL